MNTRKNRIRRLIAGVATATVGTAGLVACSSSSGGDQADGASTPVVIAQYQGIQSWITQVAIEAGIFKKHGIDAKAVAVQTGPAAMAALANDSVQLAVADTPLTGPLMEKGTKLTILTGAHNVVFSLMGAKGIDFPHKADGFPEVMQDLKGKNVGVYGLGTTAQFEVQALLEAAGMQKDDVKFQVTPGIPASLAALEAKTVDAAIISPPGQYLADKTGAQMLVDLRKPIPGLADSTPIGGIAGKLDDLVYTTQKWADANKEAAKNVQDALVETDKWMHDPANLDKMLPYLKDFGLPEGDKAAQEKYLKEALPVITTKVNAKALDAWMTFVVKYGLLKQEIPLNDYLTIPVPGIDDPKNP